MDDTYQPIYVASDSVACDGGGGALGHPRVYLAIDPKTGRIECPYCGQRFVLDPARSAPTDRAS